jgi:hypothetical protein
MTGMTGLFSLLAVLCSLKTGLQGRKKVMEVIDESRLMQWDDRFEITPWKSRNIPRRDSILACRQRHVWLAAQSLVARLGNASTPYQLGLPPPAISGKSGRKKLAMWKSRNSCLSGRCACRSTRDTRHVLMTTANTANTAMTRVLVIPGSWMQMRLGFQPFSRAGHAIQIFHVTWGLSQALSILIASIVASSVVLSPLLTSPANLTHSRHTLYVVG